MEKVQTKPKFSCLTVMGWLSCHQPQDLIKLLMNPNMSLGSQELSLVSSACRLILVFPFFFFPPPPTFFPSKQKKKKKKKKKNLFIIIYSTLSTEAQPRMT